MTQDNGARAAQLARLFHETYERLAPEFGYRTREASAVPWAEVPDANRSLMIATAAAILANGAVFLPDAAELDRLRAALERIAAHDAADVADAQVMRDIAHAALAPEESAGTHEPDRINEANALGYREGYRAAEAAHKVATPPAEPLPREALDVERLATAMTGLVFMDETSNRGVAEKIAAAYGPVPGLDVKRLERAVSAVGGYSHYSPAAIAEAIAREYAALSPDRPTT